MKAAESKNNHIPAQSQGHWGLAQDGIQPAEDRNRLCPSRGTDFAASREVFLGKLGKANLVKSATAYCLVTPWLRLTVQIEIVKLRKVTKAGRFWGRRV